MAASLDVIELIGIVMKEWYVLMERGRGTRKFRPSAKEYDDLPRLKYSEKNRPSTVLVGPQVSVKTDGRPSLFGQLRV